jgi:hypothetical protein
VAALGLLKCLEMVSTMISPNSRVQSSPSSTPSARSGMPSVHSAVCGRGQEECIPERNAIGPTQARASSEQVLDPMESSSVDFCRTRATYMPASLLPRVV